MKRLRPTLLALLTLPSISWAQLHVSNAILGTVDSPDTVNDGYTFQNTVTSLLGFQAGGRNYTVGSTANQAYARRNNTIRDETTESNESSVWYRSVPGVTGSFVSAYETDYPRLLLGNDINRG
jgi:hypothetical protein